MQKSINRLLKKTFWGKLSVERFPPGPFQRLLVPEKTPILRGGYQEELKVFGESLREPFREKFLSRVFQKPVKILIAVLALFLSISGCGYHIAGKGGHMPGGITSMSIPMFTNATPKPDIEATLTTAFVNEMVNTVNVVDSAEAVMLGTIRSYTLTPVSFSKNDVNQEYRLTVILSIKVIKDHKDKTEVAPNDISRILWEDDNIVDNEDFTVNVGDITATRSREAEALRKIARDTARLTKERILEGF